MFYIVQNEHTDIAVQFLHKSSAANNALITQ